MAFGKCCPLLYILMFIFTSNYLQDAYAGKICGPYKWGKRFYFAVPGYYYANYNNYPASYNISIRIQAKESGSVTILAKGQNISSSQDVNNGETSLYLPETVVQSYGQPTIQRKAIRLRSTTKISAKLIVSGKYFSKKFYGEVDLLPAPRISSKYTIPFHGTMGIHIVGLKKTNFNITYHYYGQRKTVEGKLRKFNSFLLNGTFPSGIELIESDEPVAVFYDNVYTYRGQYNTNDYMYVNQIPTDAIGNKYIIPSESRLFYFRAIALNNGTVIEVSNNSRTYIMMLDEGEYIQSMSNTHIISLSSNKDLRVTRYQKEKSRYRSDTIASVPALTQYCNGYEFDVNSNSDLTVIAESHHKDEFVFHERYIPWWSQVSYIVVNGTEYFVAKMTLAYDPGDHFRKVYLRSKNATFGGFLGIEPLGIRN